MLHPAMAWTALQLKAQTYSQADRNDASGCAVLCCAALPHGRASHADAFQIVCFGIACTELQSEQDRRCCWCVDLLLTELGHAQHRIAQSGCHNNPRADLELIP